MVAYLIVKLQKGRILEVFKQQKAFKWLEMALSGVLSSLKSALE